MWSSTRPCLVCGRSGGIGGGSRGGRQGQRSAAGANAAHGNEAEHQSQGGEPQSGGSASNAAAAHAWCRTARATCHHRRRPDGGIVGYGFPRSRGTVLPASRWLTCPDDWELCQPRSEGSTRQPLRRVPSCGAPDPLLLRRAGFTRGGTRTGSGADSAAKQVCTPPWGVAGGSMWG